MTTPSDDGGMKSKGQMTPEEKKNIYNIMCLFPALVRYPFIFNNRWIFKTLMSFPAPLLRLIYNFVYLWGMSRIHKVDVPMLTKLALLRRHISGSSKILEGLGSRWHNLKNKYPVAAEKSKPATR